MTYFSGPVAGRGRANQSPPALRRSTAEGEPSAGRDRPNGGPGPRGPQTAESEPGVRRDSLNRSPFPQRRSAPSRSAGSPQSTRTDGGPAARRAGADGSPARRPVRAEVGVLTALPGEMRAVVGALKRMYDYGSRRLEDGAPVHEAWLPDWRGRHVRVAAVQAQPGAEAAAHAFRRLVEEYQPATVVLVGIAGGVSPRVAPGDVVLSDRVVHSAHRDGADEERQSPSHRLGEFLVAVPLTQERTNGDSYRLHHGPIGSGDAAVTDAGSEIRRWLTRSSRTVLAVETDGAGVAGSVPAGVRARLTVRGIAATADQPATDAGRERAARHAAEVMAMLVPFLHPGR